MIEESLYKLLDYIEKERYRGYDPYDLLKSPLFKLPVLRSNKKIRFLAQQLGKRFPLNIRPLLFVPKGLNPVTLGLSIQAYSYLFAKTKDTKYTERIDYLIDELEALIPSGYSGACWGYDFPWEARYATIPAFQPTVVATGIITNGLFESYRITGNKRALDLCISASNFVINDLKRTYVGENFCFSYSPFDQQQVYNASIKGARLLSQVYSLTGDEHLKLLALKSTAFVVNNQNTDGSWAYSQSKVGKWVDNYHTGYILDCLDEVIRNTIATQFQGYLEKGYQYYVQNFFEPDNKPKFFNNSLYPIDCTAAGQSILTLCRFGDTDKAMQVATHAIKEMQSKKGYFYFRKHKPFTQRTSFMRWSNAWMFASLSMLLRLK